VDGVAMSDLLGLFWGRRPDRRPPPRPARRRTAPLAMGQRVRLRNPIGGPTKVWIPDGTTGTVIGGDPRARQVSVELDTPRTVITVPWAWVEDEPDDDQAGAGPAPAPG
jgi:hypothetical protein